MNTLKIIAVACLLSMAGQVAAELEGNIGITNNYVWRGFTQTQDQAAVSGGLDYSAESGFYAGAWASNVDFGADADSAGYELDLYFGYGGELDNGISYDIGYIYYAYPSLDDSDFSEVYVGGGIGGFSASISFQVDADFTDEDYIYYTAGYDFELNDDYGLGFSVGNYDFGDDGDSVVNYGVTLSKGDLSFALIANDSEDDDVRAVVSYGWTF